MLPSARSQGEPLTGRFNIVAGENIEHVLMGKEQQHYMLSSDAGYGFICQFNDLVSRNKNGKAILTLPTGAKSMTPVAVNDVANDNVLAVSNEGRMLVFPVADLPQLSKGKGNKIISIPALRAQTREEYMVAIATVPADATVTLLAGKRKLTLKPADIEHYRGERGRRGNKLPRGLQRVDAVRIEPQANDSADSSTEDDS